jgi:hypothetical protein
MRSVPVSILGFFAVVWLVSGLMVAGQVSVLPVVAAVAVSAALVWAAASADRAYAGPRLSAAEQKRIGRLVGLASAAEGVAILVAVNVLINLGLGAYQLPVIAMIVGLHFVPLARIPRAGLYYVTAASLVGLGVIGCLLPEAVRPLIVGVGAAVICWLTAGSVLARWRQAAAVTA